MKKKSGKQRRFTEKLRAAKLQREGWCSARRSECAFCEDLDDALCAAINKTAAKFRKRLPAKQIDRLIVRILSDQLYYAVHEERNGI